MATPIDPKRLENLEAALKKHKSKDLLDQKQLGAIYGVSPGRISGLVKNRFEDFPPAQRDADGKHWYPAGAAIKAMIDYCKDSSKSQNRKRAAIGKIMSKSEPAANDDQPPQLTAADLDRMASAATKIWRLEQEQGKYIKVEDAVSGYRSIYSLTRTEMMGWLNQVDPNGALPLDTRKKIETSIRSSLVKLQGLIEDLNALPPDIEEAAE